jgi:hypothetical protein
MWGHRSSYLRLFADNHGLKDAWVAEREGARDCGITARKGYGAEGWGEGVQIVTYFVDGERGGFEEFTGGGECVCAMKRLASR